MALKNFKANTQKSLINWTGKKIMGFHTGTINLSNGTLEVEEGITHALSFEAKVDVQGNTISAAGAIIVDRTKYGIKFGSGNFFKALGDNLIYNDFTLDLNLVAMAN